MELPIKLISTDFDGTIHGAFDDPPVPMEFQRLIQGMQRHGARWIINTGRDMPSLRQALDQARLFVQPDYIVVAEREIFYRENGQLLPCVEWNNQCTREHELLFERIKPRLDPLVTWINKRYKATVYDDIYSPFCLIAASNKDADAILDHVLKYFQDVPELTVVRNDIYARFSHENYHKGTAMTEIGRQNGITRDYIFAAGDHYNDIPMLSSERARWLAAPVNSIPEIKDLVTRQNGYVSQQPFGLGVVRALEHFLESEGYATFRLV